MNRLMRNTWVEIDLDQLARNIAALRNFAGAGVRLAPVIKADAYGHGAIEVARELWRLDVAYLSVAILTEALELRRHGIRAPILVLGHTENDCLDVAVRNDITTTIFDHGQAVILSREARKHDTVANVHIKVDTGFHRLGKEPSAGYADEILRMSRLPGISLKGIFSHLRLADDEGDEKQFALFCSFIRALGDVGVHFEFHHISDSIGAVKRRDYAMDMIRPGAIIYGHVPHYQVGRIDVKPVMTFKTTVTRVHAIPAGGGVGYDEDFKAGEGTVVATLAAGYSDGYPRHLSRKGEVLIRNRRAKVIGIVCMDQMMVDVSHIDGVQAGDEAILFGHGEGAPDVGELAGLAGTNRNDILSGISRRVPRVYLKNGSRCCIVDHLVPQESD